MASAGELAHLILSGINSLDEARALAPDVQLQTERAHSKITHSMQLVVEAVAMAAAAANKLDEAMRNLPAREVDAAGRMAAQSAELTQRAVQVFDYAVGTGAGDLMINATSQAAAAQLSMNEAAGAVVSMVHELSRSQITLINAQWKVREVATLLEVPGADEARVFSGAVVTSAGEAIAALTAARESAEEYVARL